MSLPAFNSEGDFPPGVYHSTIPEVKSRLGVGSSERERLADQLDRIVQLARGTGSLQSLIVFGSFVTAKSHPNDVDVILIMKDDFRLEQCGGAECVLFSHERAQKELDASIFWIRPSLLINDSLEQFIARWQQKREGGLRGIVEIIK